jgi:hypothetical protein
MHPKLIRARGAWTAHPPGEPLPVIEGTLIRLAPARGEQMWLWAPVPEAGPELVAALWQAYLRRFDIERGKPDCCHKRVRLSSSGLPSVSELVLAS